MYFPDLIWHKILEYRHGCRPYGFWKWKTNIHNSLQEINKNNKLYYWSSGILYVYDNNGMLDFCIYKIYAYEEKHFFDKKKIYKPIKILFNNKKYKDSFFKKCLYTT
jgi:hypothetical protein